jgi:hypothetical protein
MSDGVNLTYSDISLLLFALDGGKAGSVPNLDSCEEACPVIESVEEVLCGGTIDPRQQLVRHLNNHLREAMIESGMFELMATAQPGAAQQVSAEEARRFHLVKEQLAHWSCDIQLTEPERQLLYGSLSRLPRSSWITMPRAMWRLRKKLK